jgi:hypothetical protein
VVPFADLRVERPVIVKPAEAKQTQREQVKQPRPPLAHVKSVDAEYAEEGEQNPSNRIVDQTCHKSSICSPVHGGNQKQVNNPADEKQAKGKKPDRTGHWLAVVKAMRASETEKPEQAANDFAVCIRCYVHLDRDRNVLDRVLQLHARCAFVLAWASL